MYDRKGDAFRLREYDYSQDGYYFVTACTKNRKCFFGKITGGKMVLNAIGQIAREFWLKIPGHFPFVQLGNFVVMPNHIHGIIIIDNPVAACHGMPLRFGKFAKPVSHSLSMIVNHFKGSLKCWCNQNGHEYFLWQPLFYEHVIRSEGSLENIHEYIEANPENWDRDRNHPKRGIE